MIQDEADGHNLSVHAALAVIQEAAGTLRTCRFCDEFLR